MPYNIDELTMQDNSQEEQYRTREIFEVLKEKAINNEFISEHEADFFCSGVRLSFLDDGKIEDYSCCSNYKFVSLYLDYYRDLSGHSNYEKIRGVGVYNPGINEIKKDVAYLNNVKNHWASIVSITNHSNELLKHISKEAREDLKSVERNKGKLLFKREKDKYAIDKMKVLLQSKFIYCLALKIFEMHSSDDFILNLNGHDIEFNEYSITHILSRHFAEITRPNPNRSFHNENFIPRQLNIQLKSILEAINNSGVYANQPIQKIAFKFQNKDYLIWTNEQTKQVAGIGNINYIRLETFYPIENRVDIQDLNTNYTLVQINEEISVYLKNDLI